MDQSKERSHNNIETRKLSLEQELLLTLMRLRVGLLIEDLAFRFRISVGLASSIFTTWIKFIAKELSFLIHWPDRYIVKRNLPSMFRKYYPDCCIIIDCAEIKCETPSSLEANATCYSHYKAAPTFKFLIGITPNGSVSFLSKCYGGRATDAFIVNDSRILNELQPGDQVMADRGFKIEDLLNYYQCTLAIPPSKNKCQQMTKKEVKETSKIANVRIYVEQAIERMKVFRIIYQNKVPLTLAPIIDDIVLVCAIFNNLQPPLCLPE